MRKVIHSFYLFLSIFLIYCTTYKIPFKAEGFSGGFGGPQNETEEKTPKIINKNPVIFVHGIYSSAGFFIPARDWFLSNGYNVYEIFAIEFSDNSTPILYNAALELKKFVQKVIEYTQKDKVVLIGHSRGVPIIRIYKRFLGGIKNISHIVYIAGPNHGTPLANINSPLYPEHNFIRSLNTPTETLPDIKYLCIRAESDRYYPGKFKNSPFLNGAKNIMIPQTNHLDVAINKNTFKEILDFINN